MKAFLDCGAYDGCSVRKFRTEYDPREEYEVYSFEANPDFARCFRDFPKHTFSTRAVWVEDGHKPFYIDRKRALGSTLLVEKKTGRLDRERPVQADTVDLSQWILKSFTEGDEVLLKLDVEGAEYPILKKMIQDGSIARIRKLFIEWHWDKIGLPEEEHRSLVSELQKRGVEIEDWDALDYILPRE